jgi:hypothetical protein
MKKLLSIFTILIVIFAIHSCENNDPVPEQPDPFSRDKESIKALMKSFQESIRTRNGAQMRKLFWNENIVWVGAGHPESHRFYQTLDPNIQQVEQGGAYQFLDDPIYQGIALEEVFFEPTIDTDGQVALASFNYVFKVNGAASNWGREYWQLAKVGSDWKILHLLYSYNAVEVKSVPPSLR